MRRKGQLYIGITLLVIGGLVLFRNLTGVRLWAYIWPTLIIGLGVWVIARPQMVQERDVSFRFIAEDERDGPWQVVNEEIWSLVGDVELDMTQAAIPPGETTIRVFGFVGEVDLRLPSDVGFAVETTAFFTEAKILKQPYENFLVPLHITSPNYDSAERKIDLEITAFVATPKVRQV